MPRDLLSRRSLLTIAGSCTIASLGVGAVHARDTDDFSRESFEIMPGTDRETTVHVTDGPQEGPTVVVIGGIHGNETAGYVAAGEIANWEIGAGTLITIPEANAVAIEHGTRTDADGRDLNRQFPEGGEPGTELARAIWDVLLEYDPDVVIDLHESIGIYAGDPVDGVGQAIFHSGGQGVTTAADDAITYVNEQYVEDDKLAFMTGGFTGPNTEPTGLLVHKASRDLGADAFLVETLSVDIDLETRVHWQLALVERLVADGLFPDGSDNGDPDVDEPPEEPDTEPDTDPEEPDDDPGESPTAEIRTIPDDAAERTLESGDTVELDGTCSDAPDGDIVSYEWYITDDDDPDETGGQVDVTVSAESEYPIVLRVEDDEGRSDTAEITLSTT
ncbi:PKD domain-containing protein [Natronosalvus vescus]|uniref:PKD domain-containing protein n=1 Tax=Natronosalvus vescus TaxID=2953881 RepID=UPI002090C1E5|nr:succinylglutamate desuccinylase/aspartoacylase family protein [Natronosalvus vescus]